jgi:hypothetical protein
MAKKRATTKDVKRKLDPKRITDADQVRAWCLLMLGREPVEGEVLELVHVRDQLWELREAKQ